MSFQVFLTRGASLDLAELYDYIWAHDASEKANHVFNRVEKVVLSLSENPERGSYPKELLAVGIREYRELLFKPYRIIYRVMGNIVYVMVIADGRRDMQTLLLRRLLKP